MANKRYRTNVYIGNGISKTISAKTPEELEKKKFDLLREVEEGKDPSVNATFGFWAVRWYKRKESSGCSAGTMMQYYSAIEHLKRFDGGRFEKKRFRDISLDAFEEYLRRFSDAPLNQTGKPPSKATIKSVIKTYNSIATLAEMNGVPGAKAFKDVMISKEALERVKERKPLSYEQLQWIEKTPDYAAEKYGEPARAQCAAMIMTFAGLRRGELIPLRWSDVDLDRGFIDVKRSVAFDKDKPIVKEGGKTKAAVRRVPIPPVLVNYLIQYKSTFGKMRSMLVCSQRDGSLHTSTSFRKMWEDYYQWLLYKYVYDASLENVPEDQWPRKGAPIDKQGMYNIKPFRNIIIDKDDPMYFTPHQLRHTCATFLVLQRVPLQEAKIIMGHSSITVTSDIYTHIENGEYSIFDLPDDLRQRLETDFKVRVA